MKIKAFIFSLRGKAIIATAFFVVVLMAFGGYIILSREKNLYIDDRKHQATVLIETAGINFANALLYQEVGLIEEKWVLDQYIADLLRKEKNILTVAVFDNKGIIIAHSNLFEYGKFYPNSKDIIVATGTVISEVKDRARGPVLEAVTPLTIGSRRIATLRMEFSLKGFYENLARLGNRIVFITVLAITGSILLIVFGFNAMTSPLRKLTSDMDGIEYGRYAEYSNGEQNREDEIGVLQRSFSAMVRRLKEADMKWENTFNSITDLISIHTKDYRIVKVNNALARRFHTTPDALVGRYCWEVYHSSDGVCPDCPHAKTLMTGKPSTCEEEYRSLDGIFLTTTFPYLNEEGKIIGTIHIAKDITAEKRLQKKLVQSERMNVMGQMAAGIAHTINNPLNSILGYSTYVLENLDASNPNREELSRIVNATVRCKETVKRFLDLARDPYQDEELVNLEEVLEEVLALCRHALSSRRIEVTKRVGLELWLSAGGNEIEDALLNIVLNACDAMPDGGGLAITAQREADLITLTISDTGCGIRPEDLPNVFDPFFTTKEPGKGTGLGLAVTHNIIKNLKGNIDVHSEVGKGTTFTITFPAAQSE